MRWYLSRNGQTAGPFEEQQLRDWAASGTIGLESWVRDEQTSRWVAIGDSPFKASLRIQPPVKGTFVWATLGAITGITVVLLPTHSSAVVEWFIIIALATALVPLIRSWILQRRQLKALSMIIDAEKAAQTIHELAERDASETRNRAEQDATLIQQQAQQAVAQTSALHAQLSSEVASLEERLSQLLTTLAQYTREEELVDVGFYKPKYDFGSSQAFKQALEKIHAKRELMLATKAAAACHTEWTIEGSRAEGRKITERILKLMVRAFNGECDTLISRATYKNITTLADKLNRAWLAINKLGASFGCYIEADYVAVCENELHLTYEYQLKIQDEKEEQRALREQLREEERARREMEQAIAEAERETENYERALEKARREVEATTGEKHDNLVGKIEVLTQQLAEAQLNKQRAESRAQQTRSGHVYIISNVGSFGENIYKIGMTRRLDPLDRVNELGDASVPFRFDVHAMIYTDDAPTLENQLQRIFNDRRVNMINMRREFFAVSLDAIASAVKSLHAGEFILTQAAEAPEYRQTLAFREQGAAKTQS